MSGVFRGVVKADRDASESLRSPLAPVAGGFAVLSMRWRPLVAALAMLLAIGAACSGGGGSGGVAPPPLALEPAFDGIDFTRPVKLVQHPSEDERWYVVEQGGLVWTFLASDPDGTVDVAADVDALVNLGDTARSEQGLLGIAFDPDFDLSGEIYLAYTDEGADDSVLARWESDDDGLTFDPSTDPIVLAVSHPRSNHNGGDLVFGPDGMLYYSLGDGGGAEDPDENGQDTTTLLGSILRLDVRAAPPSGRDYAIPFDNPFAANPHCDSGSGASPCPELFAFGLRNPWRMHFDPLTGVLWVGDVGERNQEEIDRIVSGGNYGWDCLEGELAFELNAACDTDSFVPPETVHGREEARAITGGAVYRGASIPGLVGFYVYGDFETGRFFAFDTRVSDAPVQRLALPPVAVSAFGQGRDGELYVVGFGMPSLQKMVAASGQLAP